MAYDDESGGPRAHKHEEMHPLKGESVPDTGTCYTKEELVELSNTPGLNFARKFLLIIFWICWLAMIGWSAFIVVKAPKCKTPPTEPWYVEGPICKVNNKNGFSLENVESAIFNGILVENLFESINSTEVNSAQIDQLEKIKIEAKAKDLKVVLALSFLDGATAIDENELSGFLNSTNVDGFFYDPNDKNDKFKFLENINKNKFGKVIVSKNFGQFDVNRTNNDFVKYATIDNLDENLLQSAKNFLENEESYIIWESNSVFEGRGDNVTEEIVLATNAEIFAATLPGGFFSDNRDTGLVGLMNKWRKKYVSLQVSKSEEFPVQWSQNGFVRRFDLRESVGVFLNQNVETENKIDTNGLNTTALHLDGDVDIIYQNLPNFQEKSQTIDEIILQPKTATVIVAK